MSKSTLYLGMGKVGHGLGSVARSGRTRALCFLLLAAAAGCRPAPPEGSSDGEPPAAPAIGYGIFHGRWRHGDHVLYEIVHELGETPAVLAPSNSFSRSVIRDVRYRGRKLEFGQTEHAAAESDEADLLQNRTVYETTGTVWQVVMRVAINNPHTVLLEKTDSAVVLKCLLIRLPRSAPDGPPAWDAATNAWPGAIGDDSPQT